MNKVSFIKDVVKKHKPKNCKQDLFKKNKPKILDINQDTLNEGDYITATETPASTSSSSPLLPPISTTETPAGIPTNSPPSLAQTFLPPQILNYFDSENSTSFNGILKIETIFYLDGSFASAVTGIDLRYISTDSPEFYNIPTLNGTDYPTIQVNTICVNNTPLNFPVINAIISTSYNKISLGNFSTEFFTKLGANKTSDGNWIVPDPVDVTFDVRTDSGPIIGIVISSFLTCKSMIKGQCISIFDDKFANKANNATCTIGVAERSEAFCPIPGPTGAPPAPPQTTILPKPTPTFPLPKILELNTFSTDNQSQSLQYLFQVQIGSNSSLNMMPDTSINDIGVCSEFCYQLTIGSCNNRQHIFNSKNLSSFSQNGTKGSINYLDGSFANGSFGNDFIILDYFEFATKYSILLFSQINGALQAESAIEGVMELGLTIGFAFPNYPCPVGSIAFGGIDSRFSNCAKKTSAGNWIVPTPVDIAFDLITNSGLIIGTIMPRTIFDDSPGPLNSTNSIILGRPFIQLFNFVVNKRERIVGIADRNNFCPISTPTGAPPIPPQTTILPQPIQTFPLPQILNLNRFKTDNQSSEDLFQIKIGSKALQALNIIPDTCINDIGICSELCYQSITSNYNNRQHIFDSKNSLSFSLNGTTGSIDYLDGSFAKGLFGNDFITLGGFGFANAFSFLLFSQISGALQTESAVEGIIGLGLSSQIWNQLANNGYDQAIGFALPNSVCDFDPNEIFNIPTLNDSTYPKIKINVIWIKNTPLAFPVIDAIISTNYNKISLSSYSTKFFKTLGATKLKDGSLVSNPVDILFDLSTDSGLIVGAIIPSNLTCNMINEKCISIFDDLPGPLNSTNSIIIGKSFIQ
ncbi:13798_t:CDS:10, partial [Gigaspora margarita]